NHSYFNISAKPDIKGLFVQVNSDYITNVDAGLIPTGELLPVDGTLFDLREGDIIGNRLAHMDECPLMKAVAGYDTNFVIRGEGLRVAAVVKDAETGRVMTVKTTEPAMQIYTANSMDNIGHGGAHYGNYAGIALETQHYPDSPNHPEFPTTTLKAGDTFQSTTIYAFSVEK
ncbi:MAG: galactose-1-epimerase, partial [Clostridia bacterium]|nr:galactose-1-epimerase [Clostridia bacterium]